MNGQKKNKFLRIAFITSFLLVLAFATTVVFAQDDAPTDDQVNAIAKQLYCPVCENTPLDVCPTEACRQWRELIRSQIAEGMTEDEIKQYFVDNYGARVLGEPPRTGLNWLVYILPPLIILTGAFFLFRAFQVWTKPKAVESGSGEEGTGSSSEAKDDYVARFEEELKNRK